MTVVPFQPPAPPRPLDGAELREAFDLLVLLVSRWSEDNLEVAFQLGAIRNGRVIEGRTARLHVVPLVETTASTQHISAGEYVYRTDPYPVPSVQVGGRSMTAADLIAVVSMMSDRPLPRLVRHIIAEDYFQWSAAGIDAPEHAQVLRTYAEAAECLRDFIADEQASWRRMQAWTTPTSLACRARRAWRRLLDGRRA